ncbi:hypothetical protein [Klebsiella grimontii]|uniref:hypothetical protein n=1 Tax=Klebsiella grimontii TaxID=2058152 RepID=UPI001CC8F91E|nr:hypothetical protein [Klebsiella grimontii]MBZ7650631.1 hypothetical protein [Klebsiella grimontii]
MNGNGFLFVIFCVFIIPALIGGGFLIFLILWSKGRVIGKSMSVAYVFLFFAAIILCAVYKYLGFLYTFTLDHFIYFSWAAGAALILALILFSTFSVKNAGFIHALTLLTFALIANKFIGPSMEQVDMSFAERDRANSIAEFRLGKFTVQKLPELDRLFKSKSQQEQYEIYLFAIYDKSLPKELYQYFVQQLGSPLKNRQGSFDYVANQSDYYTIPFFEAIHSQNLTALQVFIDAIQASSAAERKQAQDIVYAAPAQWTGLEHTFAQPIDVYYKRPTHPDSVIKQAELLLSAFPELAKTQTGVAIIDRTIQNADVRAMRLFAKYSQPGSEILTAASYVLGGETDEFVDILKKQPSLLRQQIDIGKYYSGSTNLLFYVVMFGKKDIIQQVIPRINWQDPELYYNKGNSLVLAYAARRVKNAFYNASLETNKDAVEIFTLLLNTQLRNQPNIPDRQLWDIAADDFYRSHWPNTGETFNDEAIRSICHSDIGPQFLRYIDTLDKNDNETVKSRVSGIKKACH